MKLILVTGASDGIGLCISRILKTEGYSVIGIGRRSRTSIPNGDYIFKDYLEADVTSMEFEEVLAAFLAKYIGEISGLVNNIGKSKWRSIGNIDFDFIADMFKINLAHIFIVTKNVLKFNPNLKSIVNVASIAARRGSANNSVYSSMKFGIIGITQSLAKELGKHDVRVNSVSPVLIKTQGLLDAITENDAPSYGIKTEVFFTDFAEKQSALNRLPTQEEVAHVVEFLLSEKSSAISGQNINVDCGVFPQ